MGIILSTPITPPKPFFPARPVNGGKLEVAPPRIGDFASEPKFDGWRVTIHVPSLLAGLPCCQNRHGEMLSIEDKFTEALAELREKLDGYADMLYIDAEGLQNRHQYAKGCLIILDYVPILRAQFVLTYTLRRDRLERMGITTAPLAPGEWVANSLYLTPTFTDPVALWKLLREMNKGYRTSNTKGGEEGFYEGIVRKDRTSKYPFPKSATTEFPLWIKHRFKG